jgi:replicative DNA helicase
VARSVRGLRGNGATDGGGSGAGLAGSGRGRIPPQDLEAEKAVLSAILLENDAVHAVYTEVKPDDFYHPAHRTLYEAMIALKDANLPVDLHTLSDHLNGKKLLDAIGGPVALAELSDYEATAANVLHHARIVHDKATKRRLISVATEIVELGYDGSEQAGPLLDAAESRIFEITQATSRPSFRSLHDEMQDTFDYVEALMSRGGELTGLPTGYADLDEMTGGLQPGELIIIAARPSMGKTALALNIARNAAVDHGKKVAVFSLEMTTRSLVLRLLAAEARIDSSAFRRGFIAHNDHTRLVNAAGRLANAHIWIDDGSAATLLEIKAKSRRLKAERGLDLVVVDYLQLAHCDGHAERREQEISEISRGLKGLAKELDIPVLTLSQLNRGPEARADKRPMLADLRESGAIEQDADLIGFIYRDEVYNKDSDDEGIAELIISKQRNGPTGSIRLRFEGRFARFESLSGRSDAAPAASGAGAGGASPGAPDPLEQEPF